jgi:flagellar motor switch protein FliN
MAEIKPGTPLHLLAEPFRQAFSDALSQAPAAWNVAISTEDAPASTEAAALCFGVSASGGLKGNAAFEIKTPDALLLAQKLLSERPDPAAELNANHKQAIEEFLRKVAAATATAFKGQFGEVTLQLDLIEAPAWRGASVTFLASDAATAGIPIKLQFDSELLASARPPASEAPAASPAATPAKPPSTGDSHLDLLLGVDLNLTLRFGQRTLTLREILELTSGSIIELDRQVQEPADLLLGDKLIARGEVVIVDGNYGLRITEVSDAQSGADRIGLAAR